jgi:putative oxidoreductase
MLLRRIARPLIAGVFISEGLAIARDPESKVEAAAPVLAAVKDVTGLTADDVALVKANGAIMFGAGALFALNRFPRLSAIALAGTLVPTTLAVTGSGTRSPTARPAPGTASSSRRTPRSWAG